MTYFVNDLSLYSPKNRACKKLLDFISQFEHVLIKDDCSLDALSSLIEDRIREINTSHPKLRPIIFQYSEKASVVPGVCRVCGCTENDPCYHPDYGTCWWADEEHTLCSHCAEKRIAEDPLTAHCVNTKEDGR